MTIMLLIRAQSQTHLSTIPIWIERNAYSVREIGRMMTNLTAKVREAREGKEVKGAGRVTGIWAGKETGQEQGEKQETWASREGSGGETGERVRGKERGRRQGQGERLEREMIFSVQFSLTMTWTMRLDMIMGDFHNVFVLFSDEELKIGPHNYPLSKVWAYNYYTSHI